MPTLTALLLIVAIILFIAAACSDGVRLYRLTCWGLAAATTAFLVRVFPLG